jgi:hypothetical protein
VQRIVLEVNAFNAIVLALALNKYAPHCKSMRKGALLKSSNAREGTVVEIGQILNFFDIGKILCNSPCKTLLRQILAEIQNNLYYPRLLSRCKGRMGGSRRGDRGAEARKR